MLYYRVAYQVVGAQSWKWRSTVLTSFNALLGLIQSYNTIPQERICVFMTTARDTMEEMLQRQNQGLVSTSIPATQMIKGHVPTSAEVARLEMELAPTGDHDEPYVFSIPVSMKEITCWINLRRTMLESEAERR